MLSGGVSTGLRVSPQKTCPPVCPPGPRPAPGHSPSRFQIRSQVTRNGPRAYAWSYTELLLPPHGLDFQVNDSKLHPGRITPRLRGHPDRLQCSSGPFGVKLMDQVNLIMNQIPPPHKLAMGIPACPWCELGAVRAVWTGTLTCSCPPASVCPTPQTAPPSQQTAWAPLLAR